MQFMELPRIVFTILDSDHLNAATRLWTPITRYGTTRQNGRCRIALA